MRYFFLASFIAVLSFASAKEAQKIFQTEGGIVAAPVVTDHLVLLCSIDSCCYAIDKKEFALVWKYKSKSPLRAPALVSDGRVYLEIGNAVTCLSEQDGSFIWKSPDNICTRTTDMDDWDYHRSAPILYGDRMYTGDDFGWIYATDTSGKRVFEYHIGSFEPIRSTFCILDSTLFFGDWNGTLYAYSLSKDSLLYTFKTVPDKKPTENYGAFITPIVANEEIITWGSRNSSLFGFDHRVGVNRWRFQELSEAWISGTPVIYGSSLYIGGADSKAAYCFKANSGELKWKTDLDQNVFSAPLVTNKMMVICDGNAYENGYGIVYYLSKQNGKILEKVVLKGSIFADPVLLGRSVLVATLEGGVYLVK